MFRHRIDDHLSLRLLDLDDAEELFALVDRNRDHLRQWLPWVDQTRTASDTCAFLDAALKQLAAGDGFHAAVVVDGTLAGVLGMHGIDRAKRASSFGYWLGREHQGRGHMTRASRALVDHLLGDLGLHRVEVRAGVDNARSRAIPERLGFTLEGILRQSEWCDGRWIDAAVYALLAPEWKAARATAADKDAGAAAGPRP